MLFGRIVALRLKNLNNKKKQMVFNSKYLNYWKLGNSINLKS